MIKEMYKQLPMMPVFYIAGTNTGSYMLQDAAIFCKNLTLNKDHQLHRNVLTDSDFYEKYSKDLQSRRFRRTTLFNEIEVVTPEPDPDIFQMYNMSPGTAEKSESILVEMAVEALRDFIVENWIPSKMHIIPMSSGYDSRLIVAILRQETEKRGMSWLGNVRFVCWQAEISDWHRIVEYQEWPQDFLFPVRENAGDVDYYAPALDFDLIGATLCEAKRFRRGMCLAEIEMTRSGLLVNDNIQRLTGLWGDEIKGWNERQQFDIGYFIGRFLFDIPSPWRRHGVEAIFPFVSYDYIKLMTKYRIRTPKDPFKLQMIKLVDPELADIEKFPNARFRLAKIVKEQGYYKYKALSSATLEKMSQRFADSWYCRTFKLQHLLPLTDEMFLYGSKQISEYIKAAIFEHLINQGCNIGV
jgi:hypothetical protein